MSVSERTAYLFLSLLEARTGSGLIPRLAGIPPPALLEMPPAEVAQRMGLNVKATRALELMRRDFDPEVVYEPLLKNGIAVLSLADAGYPERLKEIPVPPPVLYAEAKIPEGGAVGVVGTRKASATGIETARALGRALGERGVCVVSGLARGVDAAAHEGALEVGGPTVGVLGCGIDIVYPRSNARLFERVKMHGAIVSEYYLGEPPLAWRFPARNRVIAGLCDAVVVVEAPQKSGALITAHHALECGRDVWAVPGPLTALECRGSNRLLADGAGVLWDIEEFVSAYASGVVEPAMGEASPGGVPLPQTEAAVLSGVGFEPTEVDVVAGRSGVEMPRLLPALALLELKGYVRRNPGGAFVRRAAP